MKKISAEAYLVRSGLTEEDDKEDDDDMTTRKS